MKNYIFALGLLATFSTFAQSLSPADNATNQPLLYRDANGSYNGCGVRTLFMTTSPKPHHMGDISVNIFKNAKGQMFGIAKAIYLYVPDINNVNNFKRVPITSFMMANGSGKAIKLLEVKPSSEAEALISNTPEEDAFSFIVDAATGKTVQVGIQIKGEKILRLFSMKPEPFSKEEADQLASCLQQITKTK